MYDFFAVSNVSSMALVVAPSSSCKTVQHGGVKHIHFGGEVLYSGQLAVVSLGVHTEFIRSLSRSPGTRNPIPSRLA